MKYKPFTKAELEKIRDDLSNGSSCDIAADDLAWREIAKKLAAQLKLPSHRLHDDDLCTCADCCNRQSALAAYEKARGE